MKPVWIAGFLAVVLALSAIPALAQPVISAKSGLISYVEGKVYLSDQIVEPSPTHFPDVKENAVVRTAEGRAEVLLTPGVVLRLGENSSFKMLTNRLIDTRLELLTGSAVVEADEIAKDTNVTLVCKDGTVSLDKKGLYRFDTAPARLKVFEGLASAQVAGQNVEVAGGKMLGLGGTIASVEKFDKEDTDSLDNWSKRRGELVAMANVSAAKQVHDSGCAGLSFVTPVSTSQPCPSDPCAPSWRYNPWYRDDHLHPLRYSLESLRVSLLEPAERDPSLLRAAAFLYWQSWRGRLWWWRASIPDHGSYVWRILGDGVLPPRRLPRGHP